MPRRPSTRVVAPSVRPAVPPAVPPRGRPFGNPVADLAALARSVGLLGAVTPTNFHLEHLALLHDFASGRDRLPRWTYGGFDPSSTSRLHLLNGVAERLDDLPLGPLYRARAEELRTELEAAAAVGTPGFARWARARFARGPETSRADALAAHWCQERDVPAPYELLASDDRDARSLVSRLRREVARQKLPFTVRTSATLAPLAAISGDTLWVAEGRKLALGDVERTVVHEIEAHALPRARARGLAVPLFAIGTAGGSDDQEGYALLLEERHLVSGPGRRRELGARHASAALMGAGADFVLVVRTLRDRGVPLETALRAAERAFRGSHGVTPGLGRERVYLEALLRVREHLEAAPDDESVLRAGQVAIAAVEPLRAWATVPVATS